MKRFSLAVTAVLCTTILYAQLLEFPPSSALTLKGKLTDTVYAIAVKVKAGLLPVGTTVTVSDVQNGVAAVGVPVYSYVSGVPGTITTSNAEQYYMVSLLVKGSNAQASPRPVQVDFTYTRGGNTIQEQLKFTIEPAVPREAKKPEADTSQWVVRLVAGSNFDFFDAPTFKNFAGDLMIFLPDLIGSKKNKNFGLGLQAGFFNYRYFEADSSRGSTFTDRYLLDPTNTILSPGSTRYVEDRYSLTSKTNFNTVGAYLNPIVRFWEQPSKWTQIYLSIHFEGLWRTQIRQDNSVAMRKDTFTITTQQIASDIRLNQFPQVRPTYAKRSFEDIYFGIGLPVRVNIRNKFDFFISPTFGAARYEYLRREGTTRGGVTSLVERQYREGRYFLLTKAQLVTTIAPVDIAVGGEFRRINGERSFYAVYIGAVFAVDKWKK